MMKSVQEEKIKEGIQRLAQLFTKKQKFFQIHMPIHQSLIKIFQSKANITIQQIIKFAEIVKQERIQQTYLCQNLQKSIFNKKDQTKDTKNVKDAKETTNKWASSLFRFEQVLYTNYTQKWNTHKSYLKVSEQIFTQLTKQQNRYRTEIKKYIKDLLKLFQKIDDLEKQQNRSLIKLVKESKNMEKNDSLLFLSEYKKLELNMNQQLLVIAERGKLIFDFIKSIVQNQKIICKRFKELFNTFLTQRKKVYSPQKSDEKIWGLLSILQEGVQQNCQKCLEHILSEPALEAIRSMISQKKSNFGLTISYLDGGIQMFDQTLQLKSSLKQAGICMTFKNWAEVALAGGWIITSYTPAQMYLTFDHYIAIFDLQGKLLKKIHSTQTSISKIGDNNTIFITEIKKGFFSDSKEQYQIKFQDCDRMEEFQLFIENQIN